MPPLLSNADFAMLLAGAAAFAAVTALTMPADTDQRVRQRLRRIAGKERRANPPARPAGKLRRERPGALARLMRKLRGEARRGPQDLAARLRMAGLRGPGPEALFLLLPAAAPALLFPGALVALLSPASPLPAVQAVPLAIAAAALGYALPRLVLDQLIARRQSAILRAFPDALDLLLICVQSGMSVEAALAKVTRDISGQSAALAEELSLTLAELCYLPARWRAYANLGERTGIAAVKLITTALVQAERHGSSIAQALTAAALECREARAAEAERKAAALPTLLAVPLVVFFLPVLLTVILGPALIEAGDALRVHGRQFIAPGAEIRATHRPAASSSHPPAPLSGPGAP
ncbi:MULTISPECIES: type II secretion system F family protein [Rhodomicrobium]|uniref:type II secretion system F family protein n=1 Tax=Rhodomicrobium TaxID=1068 RepID=UPI000B4B6698|nr:MULTISPECIES: type II secretion system F family protein [Rhodomicrobium]